MPRLFVLALTLLLSFVVPCWGALSTANTVVGIAVGVTGPGDHAYNDMLVMGGRLIGKKYGVTYHIAVPQTEGEDKALIKLIDNGATLIFAGATYYRDAVSRLASKYPEIHFVLFDGTPPKYPANVSSVTFRVNEASFLAGVLAGRMSEKPTVCVVGGQQSPVINDFVFGFEGGVKYVSPDTKVLIRYLPAISTTFNPWNSPETAAKVARELIRDHSCGVVFGVAGSSNRGIFSVAEQEGVYVIGVDSDQDFLSPGSVLTSVMKRCDTAMVRLTEQYLQGSLENRNYSFGLGEYGVGLSPMTYTLPLVDKKTLIILDKLRFAIARGKVKVPTARCTRPR
ncbi:MAG: BMP family lipoprotein [Desulfovibrio sp.]|uniref:BMP family lipoprotein n=1 Tax=Desulfovibrio sp. 7SRBS1 TaxID=3378064 RepID=UPI003B3D1CB7